MLKPVNYLIIVRGPFTNAVMACNSIREVIWHLCRRGLSLRRFVSGASPMPAWMSPEPVDSSVVHAADAADEAVRH